MPSGWLQQCVAHAFGCGAAGDCGADRCDVGAVIDDDGRIVGGFGKIIYFEEINAYRYEL